MVPHIISDNTVTAFIGGDLRTVDSSHPHFDELKSKLRLGALEADIVPLLDLAAALRGLLLYEDDMIKVGYDGLFYNDRPIHNYLAQRIIEMAKAKMPIAPWIAFLKRLQDNPDPEIRDHLFEWMEQAKMPITPDGYFLAYKKVRDDYTSYYDDGQTRNEIGSTIFLPREQCDPDRFRTCSSGLHFCSFQYLPLYQGSQGRVVVLKINPADVVAFPTDYSSKGRAWRYTVVDEVPEDQVEFAFPKPVYATVYDDWDEPDVDDDEPGLFGRLKAWVKRKLH